MTKPKIGFFLLNFRRDTHRHYFHIYEFIEALGERVSLRLFIMDCRDEPTFQSPERIEIISGRGIRRRISWYSAIIRAFRDGYRNYYHHYTTAPARFTSFLNRLFGGKTYLWHCIVMEALDNMVQASRWSRCMLKFTFHTVHHFERAGSIQKPMTALKFARSWEYFHLRK